jgi:predicted nucleic acid-binding protein
MSPQQQPGGTVLLDTTALIRGSRLPQKTAISVLSVAELQSSIYAVDRPAQRRSRELLLAGVLERYKPLNVTYEVAISYRQIDAAVRAIGREPRRRRIDLLIAATALSHGLALATHNVGDFAGLDALIEVIELTD